MEDRILVVVHRLPARLGRLGLSLQSRGYGIDTCCPLEGQRLPDPESYRAVVVLGGAMSANDDTVLPGLRRELDWIPVVLRKQVPFLGICLGAQLLSRALGARVAPNSEGRAEIGYYPVYATAAGGDLFGGRGLRVYHWHMDGFDLPRGSQLLASGDAFPNQAFRYDGNVYALQFHPEVTLEIMTSWLQQGVRRLVLPGAQCARSQYAGHRQHHALLGQWLNCFLDQWLAGRGPVIGRQTRAPMISSPS